MIGTRSLCTLIGKITLFILALSIGPLWAQSEPWDSTEIKQLVEENLEEITAEFFHYLSLPNQSDDVAGIEQNSQYLQDFLKEIRLGSRIETTAGVPYLVADWQVGRPQTVLFYLQLDSQPADPALWDQEDPFMPVVKVKQDDGFKTVPTQTLQNKREDAYIFARAASDSKGPAFAFLSALKILKKNEKTPPYNIKIIGDFQEEKGSPTITDFVQAHRDLLSADRMLVMDGTRHISGKPTLMFGARGIAYFTLTVHGPAINLHSGQYGNVVQNPVFVMADLLHSMKDAQGRVTIAGFYDGVQFSEEERRYFASLDESWEALGQRVGSIHFDRVGATIQQALHYPSLNVRGLQAGWTGDQVRTILPNKVVAEFDIRLTPESSGAQQRDRLISHLQKQGFFVTDAPPTPSMRQRYPKIAELQFTIGKAPYRTAIDHPIGAWAFDATRRGLGHDDIIKVSTTGGSQPIAAFISTLNIPAVALRIPNPDNSIHAPNENIRYQNFMEGLQMALGVLTTPFE